jgi:hypothetical protein
MLFYKSVVSYPPAKQLEIKDLLEALRGSKFKVLVD